MTTEIKVIAIVISVAIMAALGYWIYHATYTAGYSAGGNAKQILWDTDKAAIQAISAKQAADNAAKLAAALKTNQEIHDDYEAKLATSDAHAMLFARQLRDAYIRAAADSHPVPQDPNRPIHLPQSGPQSSASIGQLLGLVSDERAECDKNADALDAVYASIAPQIL